MEMNQLSPEIIVILVVAIVGAVLILRFAKQIVRFLLVAGVIGATGAACWALLEQVRTTQQVAEAAVVTTTTQAATGLGVTVLAVLLVLALVIAGAAVGYFYLRLRWTERQMERAQRRWAPGPNAHWNPVDQQDAYPPMLLPPPSWPAPRDPTYPYAPSHYLPPQSQSSIIYVLPATEEDRELWGWE